jgi:hypothetical protein
MKIRNNLDYDRACKVAGTHPVKIAPNLYLRVRAAKKKNNPDEPDRIIGRRWALPLHDEQQAARDAHSRRDIADARAEAALQSLDADRFHTGTPIAAVEQVSPRPPAS